MLGNHGAIMTPAKVACLPRLRLANRFLLRSPTPATKSGTAPGLQPPKNPAHRVGTGKKRPKFEAPRPIPAWPCPRPWPYPRAGQETARKAYAAGVHTGNRMAGRALQITASKAIIASPIEMSRYATASIAAAR